jgi:hypothetical protein
MKKSGGRGDAISAQLDNILAKLLAQSVGNSNLEIEEGASYKVRQTQDRPAVGEIKCHGGLKFPGRHIPSSTIDLPACPLALSKNSGLHECKYDFDITRFSRRDIQPRRVPSPQILND